MGYVLVITTSCYWDVYTLFTISALVTSRSCRLFYGDGLGQVAWLVDVCALQHSDVIGK